MAHIIVNDTSPRVQYTATAAQVDFTVPFPFFTEASLLVYKTPNGQTSNDTDDLLTLNTDYTVTGEGNVAGVTLKITLTTGATAGDIITILRDEPIERTTDFQDNGDLLAETLNDEQDKEVMIMQQLEAALSRSLKGPITDTATIGLLPTGASRAGKVLAFDSSGDPTASVFSSFPSDAAIVSSFSALRAMDKTTVNSAIVEGGTSQGDADGGIYYLDTADTSSAESLPDVVVATDGGRWKLLRFYVTPPPQTVAEMKTTNLSAGSVVETAGYYAAGDGGQAKYLVKTSAAYGATPDEFGDHTLTNGNVAVLQHEGSPNVRQFGAKGDGTTDDTNAIQAAVDSFADGGVLPVPAGVYIVNSEINIKTPVLLQGEGNYDLSTVANTDGTLLVTFRWGGAADGYMFVFSASTSADMIAGTTTGDIIFGGGLTGALLDGQNTAGVGIWAASTNYSEFNVQVREFKTTGLILDGGNGALSVRNNITLHVVWGSQVDSRPMNGIHFRRFNSSPSTQNRVLSANGLIYDGDLIINQDTDNNVMWHVHGVTQSGGTGRAISFRNGATNHGRNNVVYYVNGDIKAESSTYGNRIFHHNSEGSFVSIDSGGQLHYDAIDYVNSEVWGTHKFKLRDELFVSCDMMQADGTVATNVFAVGGLWSAINFPESASGFASLSIPAPYDWNNGNIKAIEFVFTTDGTSAGNAVFRVRSVTPANLAGTATPAVDENATLAVNGSANINNKRTHTLATSIAYSRGDLLLLRLDRLPANAADTHTNNINLFGINLIYDADGPDSSGSGPYDVGPDGI